MDRASAACAYIVKTAVSEEPAGIIELPCAEFSQFGLRPGLAPPVGKEGLVIKHDNPRLMVRNARILR